jgi:ligand-binding sensor domain-containing protein/AraC-like DNA-binding protein
MNRSLLVYFWLAVSLTVSAQRIPLRIMSQTPVQGTEEVRNLIFDPYGLMWVGTDQGVRSFDGYRFRIYRSDAYSPGILPNNYVRSMTADHKDGLWIGTRDGLVHYDRRRGIFKTYHLRNENARLINALFTTRDGTVWVGTNAGVSRYDAEKDDFTSINMPQGAFSFAEDAHSNLYIGTWEGGLLRLNKESGNMVAYPRLSNRNTVRSLLMDSRGRLWIGTWEDGIVRLDHPENENDPGIHRMNEGRRDFRTFHQLVEDSVSHGIWGCCIEGLTRVDLDDETRVENYPILTFCYDMVTDGMGNLWVVTRNEGIVHLSTKPSPFYFCHLNPVGLELPVNRIQTIYTNDGNRFWLGLQPYGLALYDRHTDHVVYNNQIPGMGPFTGEEGIYARTVYDIKETRDGELWMATSQGVIVWKKGSQVRLLSRNMTPFIGDNEVKAFHCMRDGTMLVGLSGGVGIALSETKGRMLRLEENGRDFSNCDVQSFFEDHQHRLWIATEGEGIIRLTDGFIAHQYAPANGNYPIDEATAVYEDGNQRLWAISNSGGLFLYDDETDNFMPVNHLYHLGMGSIYSIQGTRSGQIWLSTDKGLVRLIPSSKGGVATTFYNIEDGIEAIRFSPNGAFSYGNELYYGSASGFFSFDPSQLGTSNSRAARLVVTELQIDDRPVGWLDSLQQKEITKCQPFFTKRITIPAGVKKFSVEFALLTYQKQEECRYAYRLEGYDHDWNITGANDRSATYQNLPEGSYKLRLQATDSYGCVVELPYSISVRVLPPWYRTWWAYLIYVLLVGAAVYGISKWYKDRVNRRARLQQRVSELLHYREMMVMKQFEGARKTLEAEEQQHSSPDEQFIQKAIDCVKQHIDDSDYDREQFASDMCVSSSTLYNKLRALTGQNVTAFISSIRLKEACRILRQRPGITITELSIAVGFNTPKYFTKLFKKEFGVSPSEYLTQEKV